MEFNIKKNDARHLSKCQVKKAQFLFESDYFIWNEAELYLRFHDIFSTALNADTDLLYENVCRTTRIIFNLIHSVHFAGTGSNAAHLKFFEVLDAWGALSEYIKRVNRFPQPFVDWFESIYKIYQAADSESGGGEKIIPFENLLRLYVYSGKEKKDALEAFNLITENRKQKLTFPRVLNLLKHLVTSSDLEHFSYSLVPKMPAVLLSDTEEKPPEQVLRNYDYEINNVYSNLSDWKTLDLNELNGKPKIPLKTFTPSIPQTELKEYFDFFRSLANKTETASSQAPTKVPQPQQSTVTSVTKTQPAPVKKEVVVTTNKKPVQPVLVKKETDKPASNQTTNSTIKPTTNNKPVNLAPSANNQLPPPPVVVVSGSTVKKPVESSNIKPAPAQVINKPVMGPMPPPTGIRPKTPPSTANITKPLASSPLSKDTQTLENYIKQAINKSIRPPTPLSQQFSQSSVGGPKPPIYTNTTTVVTRTLTEMSEDTFIKVNLNKLNASSPGVIKTTPVVHAAPASSLVRPLPPNNQPAVMAKASSQSNQNSTPTANYLVKPQISVRPLQNKPMSTSAAPTQPNVVQLKLSVQQPPLNQQTMASQMQRAPTPIVTQSQGHPTKYQQPLKTPPMNQTSNQGPVIKVFQATANTIRPATPHVNLPVENKKDSVPSNSQQSSSTSSPTKIKYHTINPHLVSRQSPESSSSVNKPAPVIIVEKELPAASSTEPVKSEIKESTSPKVSSRLSTSVNELRELETNKSSPTTSTNSKSSVPDFKIITEFKKEFKRSCNDVSFGFGALSKSINTLNDLIAKQVFGSPATSSAEEKSSSYSHSDLRMDPRMMLKKQIGSGSSSSFQHFQRSNKKNRGMVSRLGKVTANQVMTKDIGCYDANSGQQQLHYQGRVFKATKRRPCSNMFQAAMSDSPDGNSSSCYEEFIANQHPDDDEEIEIDDDEDDEDEDDDEYFEEEEEETPDDAFDPYKIDNYSYSSESKIQRQDEYDETFSAQIKGTNITSKLNAAANFTTPSRLSHSNNSSGGDSSTTTTTNNLTSVSTNDESTPGRSKAIPVATQRTPAGKNEAKGAASESAKLAAEKIIGTKESFLTLYDSSSSSSSPHIQDANVPSKQTPSVVSNSQTTPTTTNNNNESSCCCPSSCSDHNLNNNSSSMSTVISTHELSVLDVTELGRRHQIRLANTRGAAAKLGLNRPDIQNQRDEFTENKSQSMTGTMTTPTLTSSTPSRSPGEQTDAVMPPPRNIKQLKTRSSCGQQTRARNQTSSVTTTCPISTTSGTGNTLPITTTASSESPKIVENDVEQVVVAKPRNSIESSKEEVEASEKVHTKPPLIMNQPKSDKYIKLKTIEPKSVMHGVSMATELKSTANAAVTLSSLDTLNDIDSEEEVDEDETTENIFAIHNEILECNNIVFDQENDKLMMMLMSEEKRKSTSNERVKIEQHDQYEEDSEFIKHITRDNDAAADQESTDKFNPNFFNQPGNYYNNFSSVHAANKFMFDQDWSYSQTQNSNAMNFSLSDQKLIGEIVRKLKPYIYKTIRKEVRLYFERNFPPNASDNARVY